MDAITWIDGDEVELRPKAAVADPGQAVRYRDVARADRHRRQIIDALEATETPEDLDAYVAAESLVIDGLHIFDPAMAASVMQAADEHRARLMHGAQSMQRLARASEPGGTGQTHAKGNTMANNPDFKKVVQKDVEMMWPRLDQPYRFNPQEKRSEACAANAQGAAYSVGWLVPLEEAKALKIELKAHYQECQARNPKLPAFSDIFGAKVVKDDAGKPTGFVQFTAKKRAMSNAGEVNKPPRIVGADLQELTEKNIWTGSKGHIRALAFPATDPTTGHGGISLLLDAVVVTEPAYGGDGLEDDFGPAQVNFGDEEKQTTRAAADEAPERVAADMDEMPF